MSLIVVKEISAEIVPQEEIFVEIVPREKVFVEMNQVAGGSSPPYTGPYEFTPTQEEQTIPIIGLKATQNITVHKIPQNYGLITWNGSTLTVS